MSAKINEKNLKIVRKELEGLDSNELKTKLVEVTNLFNKEYELEEEYIHSSLSLKGFRNTVSQNAGILRTYISIIESRLEWISEKMIKKIYKKLSFEQIQNNIIFTSTLSKYTTEHPNDNTHEVKNDTPNKEIIIKSWN